MKQKEWWKGKDVIKITANHWKTFKLGIRIGIIIGLLVKEKHEKAK